MSQTDRADQKETSKLIVAPRALFREGPSETVLQIATEIAPLLGKHLVEQLASRGCSLPEQFTKGSNTKEATIKPTDQWVRVLAEAFGEAIPSFDRIKTQ